MKIKALLGIMPVLLLTSMLTLEFNIQLVRADGPIYIRADGSVEPLTANIASVDNVTYYFTGDINESVVVERDNIIVDGAGYTVQGIGSGTGIDLTGRRNVTVKNMRIKSFYCGITLIGSKNNRIYGNNITNNNEGIDLHWGSDNNKVARNNIVANKYYGIFIKFSSSITISGNNITNNGDGVYIDGSSNSVIYGNNITNSRFYGLVVGFFSGNEFYHNNLINNSQQVECTWSTNTWDDGYPSGGNYWSDYKERYPDAEELNGSGIWDTPYVIDEDNQDNYPLTNPWRERTVGVKAGDWAKYSVDTSWTGVLDPHLKMLSETEWGMIEVTDVQGTVVTFTGTSHFKNGSELTAAGVKWDVAPTGSFGFIFWFIGSNLQVGDRVYPSGAMTMNETVTRTYCGVPRENNYLNWSTSSTITPPPYDLNEFNCYWDQATGILTEESLEASTEDLSSSLSIHIKMVNTNLWEAPTPPTIMASLDIDPDTLNLGSMGEWITCYIELPEGYNVSDIDIYSIMLNNTFPVSLLPNPPVPVPTEIGDYDNDGIPDLMIKFNRTALTSHIYHTLGIEYGNVTLTITGNLTDGTTFEGKDTVKVIFGGDADLSGLVELPDFYVWRKNFGKTPGQFQPHIHPDFDNNEIVELPDFYIWRENFGATTPQQP